MTEYFLGVDLGTSGIKAGIVDFKGKIHSEAYWDTQTESSGPGKMSQDPDDFYLSTLKIVKDVIDKSGIKPEKIAGLAIDGQMGGIIGVDGSWRPITGLDMGLDIRSEKYNKLLHEIAGDKLAELTCGSPRNTPKMMMWAKEFTTAYKSIRKFVTLSGYVAGKIVNLEADKAFIDYTLLSFFGNEDAHKLSWSSDLTEAAGLDADKLPEILKPWDIIGKVTKQAAEISGLKEGIPVMAGAGDQPAGYLGAGFLKSGSLLDVSGSTTLMCCAADGFRADVKNKSVMYMPSVVKGKYTAFTYINGGGISLKWFRDELAAGISWDELTNKALKLPPGSENLYFIPYMGGRQCPYDDNARGSWIGLNWGHRKEHMFRAILEGLAYDYAAGLSYINELFPEYSFSALDGTGGGSKNPFWNQIKADVTGLNYNQLDDYQFSLRGCGLIVGYGLGFYNDLEKAALEINAENQRHEYKPDSENNKSYSKYLERFKRLTDAVIQSYSAD